MDKAFQGPKGLEQCLALNCHLRNICPVNGQLNDYCLLSSCYEPEAGLNAYMYNLKTGYWRG